MKKKRPKKESRGLMTHSEILYCPKMDINNLHATSDTGKLAVCCGCGEVIRRAREINLRRKIAMKNGINRFKEWFEKKVN